MKLHLCRVVVAIQFLLFAWMNLALGQTQPWVTAYYAGYMQGNATTFHLRASEIDMGAVTHIIHFALIPNADGTLDDQKDRVTAANADSIVQRAHAAGRKVLISVGASSSETGFVGATSPGNLSSFISNLLAIVTARHYDGVDVDWEPLTDADTAQYSAFIMGLRSAMSGTDPSLLLTAAVNGEAPMFSRLRDQFDQINIMTYHLSGPYAGWITWHNAALHNGGYKFPDSTRYLPCADDLVNEFTSAGIPATKLGIGIDFYGAVWMGGTGTPTGGATAPRQSWTTPPTVSYLPYYTIMDSLFAPAYYHWDPVAAAAYLSVDNPGSADDKFISYDDPTTCFEKTKYVRSHGLGGVFIWELGGGWRSGSIVPDTLLRAVKAAAFGVTNVESDPGNSSGHYELEQNYPNPFNPKTVVSAQWTVNSVVRIAVYDVLGREVTVIAQGWYPAGKYRFTFDGSTLSSGVYFCRLVTGNYTAVRKLTLLK